MKALEQTEIQLGYVPLLDCIALLWAQHQGYFIEQGLNVSLVKEASWASLRDRLAFGFLDAAHCLSAMLPAAALGDDQLGIPLQTPLVLSTNKAFISLSQQLCHELNIGLHDCVEQTATKVVDAFKNGQTLQLAHVFKHSIHHYSLREWLALVDHEVAAQYPFCTLPPPYMVEAISKQMIDGFCVGEPWNTQAELEGYSQIIASSQEIIPSVADKVLAVTAAWAEQHPQSLAALKAAIVQAQNHLRDLEDFSEVWQLLKDYQVVRFNCSTHVHVKACYKIQNIIQNLVPIEVNPQQVDFEWLVTQNCKWQRLDISQTLQQEIARQCIL